MNKILCTALLGLLFVGMTDAFFGRRGGACNTGCGVVAASCGEQQPPICTKTIMVPKTIQVPQVIQVPAKRIVIPQPATCIRTPQPPRCIRVPQPPMPVADLIKYESVPDVITYKQNPPVIRYECPVDTNVGGECNTGCATACAA
ncbi:hypothetical protein H0X48_01555 [Candidatus Dependentiae bacterium]|nr:hypothetical protein [Candidatus Dependentiae bacterium]